MYSFRLKPTYFEPVLKYLDRSIYRLVSIQKQKLKDNNGGENSVMKQKKEVSRKQQFFVKMPEAHKRGM